MVDPDRQACAAARDAASRLVVRSPKVIIVAEPGIEHEAAALFLTYKSLEKRSVPEGAPAVVIVGENTDLAEALAPHVVVVTAAASGVGWAIVEALSSEARVVIVGAEALAFAATELPERVERGQHGVTVVVISAFGDHGQIVELVRKLDAKVVLVEPSDVPASPGPDLALLAGRLGRAGLPCLRVPAVSVPPVPLGEVANEIWGVRGGRRHD